MSRVGNRVLNIPAGVEVTLNGTTLSVKGQLGQLEKSFDPLIAIKIENSQVTTIRANEEKHTKQLHGTTNALIDGMLEGVSKGFKKELTIKGVGYKAALKGNVLELAVGYSHLVNLEIPEGIKVDVPKPLEIIISGISKEKVGQFAAVVHDVRRPNSYSGKGISYKGEYIRIKEGKTASK
ncbi:50S ribosomal protein L6 [Mycoplasmopsis caviae]|uniref:Large ribosomal subunit protein uL6 n=1 Tax=Mycoplasmopsis caviae TaxID=55603 RepID=A0A3P8LB90_9BACT|nr:50S ribosomal protein L6 [Mycoplasmopsis caviae]UUD34862.1 50S ribosomal protein L6 [Mycoplasmopsis caviae]VDR42291.1 50S ribosomal protein L6 [Mycoplasmopsis caviae]